ncbi:MAG TPA: hypothetical protein VFY93_00985 [Planctomycetota bacterium]|nr:hypothetical protein [Planctomycetota bacterium]
MRLVALLLLAATVGFAIGRLTAPGVRGRGGERAAPAPVSERPIEAENEKPQLAEPARLVEVDEPDPSADVVPPSELSDDAGEDGVLLVELDGLPGAWVGNVDIVGAYETEEIETGGGEEALFRGAPGTYDVWWLDRDGRRLGTRARLEAGKITRLRSADHRTAAAVPSGLGVLSVFVEAAEGGGLRAHIDISDGRYSIDTWTNDDGHASMMIRPGRYTLVVGDHRSESVVEAGRTTFHRIAHDREGDLVLVADRLLRIDVKPAGSLESCWEDTIGAPPGSMTPVPYLMAGEYDIFIPYAFGVPFARASVHAGRATRLRCEAPKGGVLARTVPEAAEVYIVPCREVDGKTPQQAPIRLIGRQEPTLLMPGRYLLTAYAALCEPRSAEVDVADDVVEVTLELAPSR